MDCIETSLNLPIDRAESVVRDALAAQGFGVLTEIDVTATFKAKLGIDRAPLKILGACNPTLANQALQLDPSVALMIPCNVVLEGDGGHTRVTMADPRTLMPGEALAPVAAEAAARLSAAAEVISRAN